MFRVFSNEPYLIELNDIRMSNFLQNVNFSRHTLDVPLVLNAIFLQDFNRYFFACYGMSAYPHLAESARAERATYTVSFKFIRKGGQRPDNRINLTDGKPDKAQTMVLAQMVHFAGSSVHSFVPQNVLLTDNVVPNRSILCVFCQLGSCLTPIATGTVSCCFSSR